MVLYEKRHLKRERFVMTDAGDEEIVVFEKGNPVPKNDQPATIDVVIEKFPYSL